jgi:hypothetical protein
MFIVIKMFKCVISATVLGHACLCLFVFLFSRYRRFRQAAFANCGALLTTTGINDDSVVIEGAMNFSPPGLEATLHDAVLENQSWTGAPEFMFSNELAGGNDEARPDSSSEAASLSGSDTEDSSSSDSSSEAEAIQHDV